MGPRFRVGMRVGYLVSWHGELVLFIDGVEVGRARVARLANTADVWLVVDLSHDVMAVTLLDEEPPEDPEPGILPATRRCSRRSLSVGSRTRRLLRKVEFVLSPVVGCCL